MQLAEFARSVKLYCGSEKDGVNNSGDHYSTVADIGREWSRGGRIRRFV